MQSISTICLDIAKAVLSGHRRGARHTEAPFDLNNVRSKLESSTYAGLGPKAQKSHSKLWILFSRILLGSPGVSSTRLRSATLYLP
jgi:hypothetical protein